MITKRKIRIGTLAKLTATWDGIIGNNSDSFTGDTVHKTYLQNFDMCAVGTRMYVCTDYAERSGSVYAFDLNDPNKKIYVQPEGMVQQATTRICTDGTRLYMAGAESQNTPNGVTQQTYVEAAVIANLNNRSNGYLAFQGATVTTFGTTFGACDVVNSTSRVTGLAAQFTGNYFFVARRNSNSLHVLTKPASNNTGGGVLAQSLTYTNPTLLAVDSNDNLWLAHNTSTVEKFSVNNSTGALISSGVVLTGFTNVQGLSCQGSTVAVADAKSTGHVVNEYNITTGNLIGTIGQAASYGNSATVANDKFYFTDLRDSNEIFSSIAYQSDGSLWINDKGNNRIQHFGTNKLYSGKQVAFQPHIWSCGVDPNNPTRLFIGYQEYAVDYSKPLQAGNSNGAWQLVKNWGANVLPAQDGEHNRLREATTFTQNNRTYALQHSSSNNSLWEFVELTPSGVLRFTGVTIPRYEAYTLQKDSSIMGTRYTGGNAIWEKKILTGFDGSNNPQYSAFTQIASVPDVNTDPKPSSIYERQAAITSNNIIPSFRGDHSTGFHLGGVPVGGNAFAWKKAPTVNTTGNVPFPTNGDYPLDDSVQGAGSIALSIDNMIIYGYNGEGYKGAQVNKWNVFKDDGTFLLQFGALPDGTVAQAGMAGNAFSASLVKYNNVIYLYHGDESYHGGVHRWKITY